jgi:hypothetical protein
MTYYDRTSATHIDGTPIFQNAEDRAKEDEIIKLVQAKWECQLGRFGALSPIDFYVRRQERVVGIVELKSRSHEIAKYPSAWLNVRKWLALQLAMMGLGVPAVWVVKFTDAAKWIYVKNIDARRMQMGGTLWRVKSDNDIEPVIYVPLEEMSNL